MSEKLDEAYGESYPQGSPSPLDVPAASNRPFQFYGRLNEDVCAYVAQGARGGLFLTTKHVAVQQGITQSRDGGLTPLYLAAGTYVKSFYAVMYQPSSVRIFMYPTVNARLHREVTWRRHCARDPGRALEERQWCGPWRTTAVKAAAAAAQTAQAPPSEGAAGLLLAATGTRRSR